VARKLLSLVDRETSTIPEVTQIIRSDAAFASEVLRLANSAVLGLRYEVLSIMHAVTVLGMDRLRALVLTVALRDFLSGARHAELLRRCWRHNFASALVAEWLAASCWIERSDAYTAGLLHDLGQLALISLHPVEYTAMLDHALESRKDLLDAETATFGINHCQAGRWIAEHWGVPAKLRVIVCSESADHESPSPGEALPLSQLSALACCVANLTGFVLQPPTQPDHDQPSEAALVATLLQSSLPPAVWNKVEPQILETVDSIPFKINVFETEFLS
jgi:HD-like signal output (HDOD) protein